MAKEQTKAVRKDVSRLRAEVRQLKDAKKAINPFAGMVSGNYWTQTGMPWVLGDGRKAVLTEWFWQPIRGQPRRVDTNELRQFSQTYWVSSCVKTLMDEIGALDWDILQKDDYEYEWVKDDIKQVKAFLERPNKNNEPFAHILKAIVKDILEIDAGVWVKVYDVNSYDFENIEPKSGSPVLKPMGQRNMVELYARDGSSFLKETDKFGFEAGFWQYSYQIPAHPVWFNRDEVMYISEHPRSMSVYGFARTQSVLDIIKSLHYSTLYNKRFFEETTIPDGALSLLDTSTEEMQAFRTFLNNEFRAQPHKLAVINKDIKWYPFSVSNRELEFLETQKWYYRMVISAFGLTPSEMGLTDDLNRSTSATQAEVVKRKGIRPFLGLIEDAINMHIIPEFGFEGIQFQFIYDDPAEKALRLQNWQSELNMGIKTVNEVRTELGMEPLPNGDYSNSTQLLAGQSNKPGEEQFPDAKDNAKREEGKPEPKEEKKEKSYRKFIGAYPSRAMAEKVAEQYDHGIVEVREGDISTVYEVYIDTETGTKKSATIITDESVQEDLNNKLQNPYSDLTKAEDKTIPLKELIEEHKKLVAVLESDSPEEIKAEAKKQKEELEQYIEEASKSEKGVREYECPYCGKKSVSMSELFIHINFEHHSNKVDMSEKKVDIDVRDLKQKIYEELANEMYTIMIAMGKSPSEAARFVQVFRQRMRVRATHKGVDDGQYYREQPISQPIRPTGAMFQPQNEMIRNPLSADYRVPTKDTFETDTINCPMCGRPTITVLNAEETGIEDFRCTNCSARFNVRQLAEHQALTVMQNMLTQNPQTVPAWSPKSTEVPHIHKSIDDNLSVKDFVGFDATKMNNEINESIVTERYQDKLKEWFSNELSDRDIDKIISILNKGIEQNMSITQVAKYIEPIVKDAQRAMMIARTEIVRLANYGNLVKMKENGVSKVKFIAAMDDRSCDKCKGKNGDTYNRAHAMHVIPVHQMCRCRFIAL